MGHPLTRRAVPFLLLGATAALLAGCGRRPPPPSGPDVPVIPVSVPVRREVTDFVDYTGRTSAKNAVDVRPRATGYLVKAPFEEGAEVKKDQLLFEIDPRPYKALLDQAESQLELAKARRQLAAADYARARRAAMTPGVVSPQELDTLRATEVQAAAAVKAAEAAVATAKPTWADDGWSGYNHTRTSGV